MRRKRKSRGTWLPLLGTVVGESGEEGIALSSQFAVDVPSSGAAGLGIVPLTFDYPQEYPDLNTTADTLSEIAGSEYIIKRILGSCLVTARLPYDAGNDDGNDAIAVSAGFFVARAGAQNQGPLGAEAPIGYGADTVLADQEQYSPGHAATAREPWMWRRTWILGNARKAYFFNTQPSAGYDIGAGEANFPPTNAEQGIATGPSVDIKSRRRVKLDERLFFAVEARTWPLGTAQADALQNFAYVNLTIRLFGSLVKARGSGAF